MLKLIITLMMFFSSSLCFAEISPQSNLRTFFTSKQIRMQLNDMRTAGKYLENKGGNFSVLREPTTVKMQGVVFREDKKPVVFVNDENTLKTHHLSNDVTVRDHRIKKQGYKVPIRLNQQGITLRPGQQWNETTGQVQDTYQIKASKDKPEGMLDKTQSGIIK